MGALAAWSGTGCGGSFSVLSVASRSNIRCVAPRAWANWLCSRTRDLIGRYMRKITPIKVTKSIAEAVGCTAK